MNDLAWVVMHAVQAYVDCCEKQEKEGRDSLSEAIEAAIRAADEARDEMHLAKFWECPECLHVIVAHCALATCRGTLDKLHRPFNMRHVSEDDLAIVARGAASIKMHSPQDSMPSHQPRGS